MKILDRIAGKFGFVRQQPRPNSVYRRSYSGASLSRLTADWLATGSSANVELRGNIRGLRDRSRDLERNEDYAKRFFALQANNVIGACGIQLQVKAMGMSGKPDKKASDAVEAAWLKWGRKEFCTVTRIMGWNQATRLVLRSTSRDGGSLVRKVPGYSNGFGYAIQILEMDHLDLDKNQSYADGTEIIMGVEFDRWQAPIAYHIKDRHPGENQGVQTGIKTIRVPREEMLHVFDPDRASQAIGVPAMASALLRMKMLGAYEEAELTAAREAACKGYALTQATPDGYIGAAVDPQGRQLDPVEPGMTMLLQPGEVVQTLDPNHPSTAYPEFTKSIVRGIASGLGVSYNSLANDLEGVNYSSIRAGLLEEREEWKTKQEWLIEELCLPIFEDWLKWALTNGKIPSLHIGDYERVNQPYWIPRRWPWVDPAKDVEANRVAIALRLTSRARVIAEQGQDMEDIDAEFAADPVTKDLESEIAYIPQAAKTEPPAGGDNGDVPVKNGNGNGNGRINLH